MFFFSIQVTIDGILYGGNVDITHPLHTLVVDTGGKAILASNDDSLKFNADFIELAAERACDVNGHIEIVRWNKIITYN